MIKDLHIKIKRFLKVGTEIAILGVIELTCGVITHGQPSQYGCSLISFLTGQLEALRNMSLPNTGGYYA